MKPTVLALVLAFAAAPAFAHNCPNEMRTIDAALPKAKLSDSQSAEVKKLRAEGETLHKQGRHDESMAALGKAKGLLGIK